MTELVVPAQRSDAETDEYIDSFDPSSDDSADEREDLPAASPESPHRLAALSHDAGAAAGRFANHVVDRLRNNAELTADRGSTTIADEVVEKIAGIAARQAPGVYDLGGDVARVFAAVRERVGLGDAEEAGTRGVQVRLTGTSATIKVVIVVEYGSVVRTVAEAVRAEVILAVETMLGLDVTVVDIVVDDVHVEEGDAAHAR